MAKKGTARLSRVFSGDPPVLFIVEGLVTTEDAELHRGKLQLLGDRRRAVIINY
jgi:hypothetical protein